MVSGSGLVPAVSHALWYGFDYPLFGFGEKVGAPGITETHLSDPEAGLPGIALGAAFPALTWRRYVVRMDKITPPVH